MSKNLLFKFLFLAIALLIPFSGYAQKRSVQEAAVIPGSANQNELQVIQSLKDIYQAESTFFWGAGFYYESLRGLRQARLIDKDLGAGDKFGYTFTVLQTPASILEPARFVVRANPKEYRRTGFRSFYMSNKCLVTGADRGGSDADQNDPVIDQCTPTVARDFGRLAAIGMQGITAAQFTYMATTGAGSFGTHDQLLDAELLTPPLGPRYNRMAYFNWTVTPVAPGPAPATFTATATPLYRESGLLSYYADETGIIRAADRSGGPALPTDPAFDPAAPSADLLSNERIAYYLMGAVRGAQNGYSNFGATNYGTFSELRSANLFWLPFQVDRIGGYVYSLSVIPRNGSIPSHWELRLVPEQYGITGTRSFYTDEAGYIHGADKFGAPAGPKDPAIFFLN